jgi:hypothetical protein
MLSGILGSASPGTIFLFVKILQGNFENYKGKTSSMGFFTFYELRKIICLCQGQVQKTPSKLLLLNSFIVV